MALNVSMMEGSSMATHVSLPRGQALEAQCSSNIAYMGTFVYNSLRAGTITDYLSLYPHVPGTKYIFKK